MFHRAAVFIPQTPARSRLVSLIAGTHSMNVVPVPHAAVLCL